MRPATLQPLRMVKLIMLTGSFSCFIQSKPFWCHRWHNNYARHLTRRRWQAENWRAHLHKVQRKHTGVNHTHTRDERTTKSCWSKYDLWPPVLIERCSSSPLAEWWPVSLAAFARLTRRDGRTGLFIIYYYLFTHFTGRVWGQADGGHSLPPTRL